MYNSPEKSLSSSSSSSSSTTHTYHHHHSHYSSYYNNNNVPSSPLSSSSSPLSPSSPYSSLYLDPVIFSIGLKESNDDKLKKRQVRLLKNRQSAALSRTRKKEYIINLEERAQELQISTNTLKKSISFLTRCNHETQNHIQHLQKEYSSLIIDNDNIKLQLKLYNNNNNNDTNNYKENSSSISKTRSTTSSPSTTTTNNNMEDDEMIVPSSPLKNPLSSSFSSSPSPSFLSQSNPNVNSSKFNINNQYSSRIRSSSSTASYNYHHPSLLHHQLPPLPLASPTEKITWNRNYQQQERIISTSSTHNHHNHPGVAGTTRKNLLGYYHFNQMTPQQAPVSPPSPSITLSPPTQYHTTSSSTTDIQMKLDD